MSDLAALPELVPEFEQALLALDRISASEILAEVTSSKSTMEAIETLVIPSLQQIGQQFEDGLVSLSQVYMSGVICEEAIDKTLRSTAAPRRDSPRMGIAVLQDHHGLGKKIVFLTLQAAGYRVEDFGMGLSVDELVEKTLDEDVAILMVSALTLSAAMEIKELREKLAAAGMDIKIVAGGAPFRFDPRLSHEIGADATANNACEAIKVISNLVNELHEN